MSRFERFTPLHTADPELNRVQQELQRHVNRLLESLLSRSRAVVVDLAAGENAVAHGLGRIPTGFLAIAHTRGATGDIADDRETNPHTDRLLYVHTSTATAATLLIF